MAYKKDQGRFARMAAFWALFGLAAYGCFSSLTLTVDGLAGSPPWVRDFPLLGKFGIGELVSLSVLGIIGALIYRWLNRPKVADLLIDTEHELRKVTWPTAQETWYGTLAVAVTVALLLAFLFSADLLLTRVMQGLLGFGS